MDTETMNVIVCGVSGQGVTKTAEIIARAALADGYDVKMLPCGDFRAGGSSAVMIKYGSAVASAEICRGECDVLLALEKLECARMIPKLRIAGAVYASLAKIMPKSLEASGQPYPDEIFDNLAMLGIEAVAIDCDMICRMAENDRAAGVVLIGLAADKLGITKESLRDAINSVLGERDAKSSIKAFDITVGLGKDGN